MPQTATKVLTAHVPLPLAKKVDKIASRIGRSRSWIMKQALSAWVEQEEERSRLTLEALADVDVERVIEHQAVLAWADSLSTDFTGTALMELKWTKKALNDLVRLYEFLAPVNQQAAAS